MSESPAARIEVDRDRCTGIGICESLDPDHFEVLDDGSLAVLKAAVADDELEQAVAAIDGCPAEALRLIRTT